MSFKLILFDLDGTLVDTAIDLSDALNFALVPEGKAGYTVDETKAMIGDGVTRLIEKALGEEKKSAAEATVERFLDCYGKNIAVHSRPYPMVVETLERLPGYIKVVISNKRESLCVRLLQKLGMLHHFDLVIGSDTLNAKKPSPEPLFYAMRRFDMLPSETVIVGDSPFDIQAGRSSSIKTVAVTYGFKEKNTLSDADYLIDEFPNIVDILEGKTSGKDRRREERYEIPTAHRDYFLLSVMVADDMIPVRLLDFSEHGMRFKSPIPFDIGSVRACLISVPMSLSKEVDFKIVVRYCAEFEGGYNIGAEIKEIGDKVWFRVVKKVHEFMSQKEYFTNKE